MLKASADIRGGGLVDDPAARLRRARKAAKARWLRYYKGRVTCPRCQGRGDIDASDGCQEPSTDLPDRSAA